MAIIIFMLGIMHADMEALHNMTFWLKDGCTYHLRGLQEQQSLLRHNRTLSNNVRILEIMDTHMGSFHYMAFCQNDVGMEDIMLRHCFPLDIIMELALGCHRCFACAP
jgi:polysaccharide deacetylase 2 family uncharacterized protein YibQ